MGSHAQGVFTKERAHGRAIINSKGLPSAKCCAWAEAVVMYLEAIALNVWQRPPLDRINMANGVLNITEDLREHSPEFRSPVRIPVAFEPDARSPDSSSQRRC